jgi:hypothetical protein
MMTPEEIEQKAELYYLETKFRTSSSKRHFISGAKFIQEKMYSDMQEYAEFCIKCYEKGMPCIIAKDWFEQFKNK